MGLQTGKLPHSFLKELIGKRGAKDSQVVLGPKIGEDAAVVDLGDRYLILKTDPITYAVEEIGWYAVHINANDVASMGAKPRWFQASLLLPQGITESRIRSIFDQVDRACKELGIAVTGGHTEVTPWLDRPIIVGDMHGLCRKKELVKTSGAKVGDSIILTKGAGIEGTATLAREMNDHLRRRFSKRFVTKAERYLTDPGISVVKEALIGAKMGATAMHDPTEGGVATGLYEIAVASGKGVLVDSDAVLVREETAKICDFFELDPMGLLGSGALLVAMPRRRTDAYLARLAREGIEAKVIGEVVRKSEGLKTISNGRKRTLEFSQKDEILKVI